MMGLARRDSEPNQNASRSEPNGTSRGGLRALIARLWPLPILAVMLALWFSPIIKLSGGWWRGHSFWADALRGLGVAEAWRWGLWDARWFQGFDWGYGYPFLSYYAPLFHWMSGFWILLIPSASVAVRVNMLCWLVFGTAGMYLTGERLWSYFTRGQAAAFRPGLLCTMAWLMSPYPMCNVFVRSALPEFASCQAMPWVLWAGFGILGRTGTWTRRDRAELLLMVLFIAVGLMSHNFFGMCLFGAAAAMIPLVLPLRRLIYDRSNEVKSTMWLRVGAWTVGLAWSLAATVFYWLPALREGDFVRIQALKGGGYSYALHYLYPRNYLKVLYWDFGWSVPGPNDGMPLHLGLVSFVAVAGTLAAFVILATLKRRRDHGLVAGIGALALGTLAGVFLTTPLSRFLWGHISLLQFAQFPWRLLNVPTVGVCLLVPAALVAANPARRGLGVAVAVGVLALCFGASHHFYVRIKGSIPFPVNYKPPNWERMQIITVAWAVDEYGPIWRDRDRKPQWPRGGLLPNKDLEVVRSQNRRVALYATIKNRSTQRQPLIVAWNYFPAWKARVEPENVPLTVLPDPDTGFIRIEDVPVGVSKIHLWFGNTPLRLRCKIVAGTAWLIWLAAWIAPAVATLRSRRALNLC